MTIEAGQTLLHYRVTEKIGQGGMGEVWRAVDTTLERDVAIKILPEALAAEGDRLARFEREAKLLASINHPNIATLHGLHAAGDVRFLTMELVEGEDLADRIGRGPLPREEALTIAQQIAVALEAAHERGIVHRDLKPANVRLTPDGVVKVLDFGLARAFEADPASRDASQSMSPTLTSAGTIAGMIMGTAAYMSPEQARGHTADGRADVWAFGCVLYEMLTGRSLFRGDTVSDTLAGVLKVEPDWDALPADTPQRVRRLLARCLQKDRKQRLHHIADARISVEEILAGGPDEPSSTTDAQTVGIRERRLWAGALILVGAVALWGLWMGLAVRTDLTALPQRKLLVLFPEAGESVVQHEILSPDGTRVAFSADNRVWIRDLDQWDARLVAEGTNPPALFWSPDGSELGVWQSGELKRITVAGGQSTKICDAPWLDSEGGTWSPDGTIVLAHGDGGLYRVSALGGDLELIHDVNDGERDLHEPHFLPDGETLVFGVHGESGVDSIVMLVDGKRRELIQIEDQGLFGAVYSPTGHILYTRMGNNSGIWALPFDTDRLEVTGAPFLVAAGAGRPSVSRDGMLLYKVGNAGTHQLVWADRNGRVLAPIGQPQSVLIGPRLSPDGTRIVVAVEQDDDSRDLWIHHVERGTQTRLTFDPGNEASPFWTPDGRHVLFMRRAPDEAVSALMRVRADGSGAPEKLLEGVKGFALSADGRFVVFERPGTDTGSDLWYTRIDTPTEPTVLVRTPFDEGRPDLSPDGNYVAYTSSESGRPEIFLTQFPDGEGKWQVSIDGGERARFSSRGDELFFVTPTGEMMVVEIETQPELRLGTPTRLFAGNPAWMLRFLRFDVSPDAQRFVIVQPEGETELPGVVRLVENWHQEFAGR